MDMVRVTILEGEIHETLWSEIVLTITYIKNLLPNRALKGSMSPIEMQIQVLPDLHHFCSLGSSVYVFLHKKEQSPKSTKWEARALRGKLVGFDGHIIYSVYIKDQNKVIRVKDLRIFEVITSKAATSFSNFKGKSTISEVQIPDEQSPSDKKSVSEEEKNVSKKLS